VRFAHDFTGKERDSESGNDYFGARYYASSMGRFMSPDPWLDSARPENPQTWNRYSYALNSPLNNVDRNGLWPTSIHNEMIDAVFGGRLSSSQISLLKAVSAGVDSLTGGGQGTANSYQHGQCSPGQDLPSCRQAIAGWIAGNLGAARSEDMARGMTDLALTEYMKAGHTLMDQGSPSHTYDGEPTVWGGLLNPLYWFDDVTHVLGEEREDESWYGVGLSVRKLVGGFFAAFPEEAPHILGTAQGASDRAINSIVSNYFNAGGPSVHPNPVAGDAARQCALGNKAACEQ
jgi:RHS repeat-associated protein